MTDVVLTGGFLENITLRMRLLFELHLLNVFWTDL